MPRYEITAPDGRRFEVTAPEGATQEDILAYAQNQFYAQQTAPKPPEPTIGGQVKELFKGLVPGAVGMVESGITGAAALLPEEAEEAVRAKTKEVAGAIKKPFAAAPGYEETVGRKLGEAIGSVGPFLPLGALGLAGRVGAVGLGTAAGAGEARTRAEAEGVTGAERGTATALGTIPGALEAFAPLRILGRLGDDIVGGGVAYVKRALAAGGEEAAQEAASNFAQNLIAKGIYKPEQELIEGLGESAAYGGATGAIVQGLLDLAIGRRARGATPAPAAPAGIPTTATQADLFTKEEAPYAVTSDESVYAMRQQQMMEDATRQENLLRLDSLRTEFDTLQRENERLKTRFDAAETKEEKAKIKEEADKIAPALTEIQSEIKKVSKKLGAEEAARVPSAKLVGPEGQLGLDFEAPLMERRKTEEGAVIGEQPAAIEGMTPAQQDFFKQAQVASIQQRLDAGEMVTPAEQRILQEAKTVEAQRIAAAPAPEMVLPEQKRAAPPPFELVPSGEPQYTRDAAGRVQRTTPREPVVEEKPTPEQRLITEEDFAQMGIGKTNKKLREAIIGKDITKPKQRAFVREQLEAYAGVEGRSPKIASAVESFLSTGPFMEQMGFEFKPKKGEPDVTETGRVVPGAAKPSVPPSGRKRAGPPGVGKPAPAGMAPSGVGAKQPVLGTPAKPTTLTRDLQVKLNSLAEMLRKEPGAVDLTRKLANLPTDQQTYVRSKLSQTRYRRGAPATAKSTRKKVDAFVRGLTAKWKNAPTIQVVQSANELPDVLQADIMQKGIAPPGVFYDGTVYLIADNISSNSEAGLTAVHESIGHYGLRAVLGSEYTKVMNRLYNTNKAIKGRADKKIAEEGMSVEEAVEEVLAEAAEGRFKKTDNMIQAALQQLRKLISSFLGRIGITPNSREVNSLLDAFSDYVVQGKGAPGVGAAPAGIRYGEVGKPFTSDTINVDGVQRSVYNSKGQPIHATEEGIRNFWKWFGNSTAVDRQGRPTVFYHGTARDIKKFQPKQADAIFVTTDPEFAEDFSQASMDYIRKEIGRELEPEQVNVLADRVLGLAGERGYNVEGYEGTSPYDIFSEFEYELRQALNELSPTGENILPLYIKAEKPFDYDDDAQVRGIIQKLMDQGYLDPKSNKSHQFTDFLTKSELSDIRNGHESLTDIIYGNARSGNWGVIERPAFQQAIRDAGYDGFYMSETGRKNLAVYKENQVKSAIGNVGAFGQRAVTPEEAARAGMTPEEAAQAQATGDIRYARGVESKAPDWVPQNIWNLHEKTIRAEKIASGVEPSTIRPQDRTRNETMTFRRLRDAVKEYVNGDEQAMLDLMSRMRTESNQRESAPEIRYRRKPALTAAGQQAQAAVAAMGNISNTKPKQPQMTTLQKVGGFFFDPSLRQEQIDRFRVQVTSKYGSVERKMQDLYNGKIRDALGNIRPDIFVSAADHVDTLAVAAMKEGGLRLDKNIGWVADKRKDSLMGTMTRIKELGVKLGDQDLAFKLANDAFIARRAAALKKNPDSPVPDYLLPSDPQIAAGMKAFKDFPELEVAFKEWIDFKDGMIDAMVEGGRLSKDKAQQWKDGIDYVPWNRIKEYEEQIQSSPKAFQKGLVNLGDLKKLKGGKEEINNIFDNMVGLTFWMANSAVRNHAAVQLTDAFVNNKLGAKKVNPAAPDVDPNKTIFIYRDGKPEAYEFDSMADVYAFKGVESIGGPLLNSFTAASNFLRKATTAMPQFAFSQLFQDAYRAMVMSGTKHPFRTASRVISGYLDAYKGDPTTQQLERMGIVGMYDLMPGRAREEIEAEFGIKQLSLMNRALDKMESFSIASDAALRKAVFDQTLAETKSAQFPDGDVLLARYRAQEVINFKRQGANRTVGIFRQIIPFMNAYIQGMDVLYRTMTGRGIAAEEKAVAFRMFLATGIKMSALSMIYAMLVGGDDEYEGLRDYEKDKNFIIPGTGIKIPVAPEVGFLFKVLPERTWNYIASQGTDRPQDATALRKAIGSAAFDAFSGPNLTPQIVKPSLEIMVNYSFFTNTPIVGMGLKDREPFMQFTESTSELSKMLGKLANVSPMKIEHFIRGSTGIAGGTALDLSNSLFADRPDKRLYEQPFFKTFMYDQVPGGYKEQYYDLRDKVNEVASTVNALKAQGRVDELEEYLTDERLQLLALRTTMNRADQRLEDIRKYKKLVSSDDTLKGSEKKDLVEELERTENELLRAYNIPVLRKEVAGL